MADRLQWTRGTSLTVRILAVNVIVLGLLAGSLFYLDSYRNQLIRERFKLARSEAEIVSDALAETPSAGRRALLARIAQEHSLRLRLYDAKGRLTIDSHIKRLRRKFRGVDPGFGGIETLYGAGYSFADS